MDCWVSISKNRKNLHQQSLTSHLHQSHHIPNEHTWVNSPPFPTHSRCRSESSIFAFWIRDSEPQRCCTLWIESKDHEGWFFLVFFFQNSLEVVLMEMVQGFNAWEFSRKKKKIALLYVFLCCDCLQFSSFFLPIQCYLLLKKEENKLWVNHVKRCTSRH